MAYTLMKNCLTYWTYTLLCIGLHVSGEITIMTKFWRNKTVHVFNDTSFNVDSLCETILDKSKNRTHNVDGKFGNDQSKFTNLTLDLSIACLDSKNISNCSAIEGSESFPLTHLYCLYIAKDEADGSKTITARLPIVFDLELKEKMNKCYPNPPVSYHHCMFANTELLKCLSANPNFFFWTNSYITSPMDDELLVTESTTSSTTTLTTCTRYCLNVRADPKVSIIAFNATEETCACFAKDNNGRRISLFDEIFEIRDIDGSAMNIEDKFMGNKNKSCIAATYRNSTIHFHVKNCSFSYSLLCGPNRCQKQCTGCKCDYSRAEPRYIPRSKEETITPSIDPTEKTAIKPARQSAFSSELTILILTLSITCMGTSIIVFAVFKKKCRKKNKPVERGRPNSTSNRTYLIQNPARDDEEVYTTIDDDHIVKPLLPPRNNVKISGELEVTFKADYSTPSDTVKEDIDDYTDTYDSPLRRSNCVGGILQDPTSEAGKTDNITKDEDHDGYKCCSNATCALNIEEKRVHFEKTCPSTSTTHAQIDAINQLSRNKDQGDYEHCCQTLTGNEQLKQNTNNYFLLAKCEGSLITKTESLKDTDPANESDSSDYEDTSVLDERIGLKSLNKACPSNEHNYSNDPNTSSEKSLLCTISPFLLKHLNIKIVPDDNEYAMHYLKGPRRSSDERLSKSDLPGSGVTQCSCYNPQDTAFNHRGANNIDMAHDYDKLCSVRRVVSAGKQESRCMYNHTVLKRDDSCEKIVIRRSSV